MDEEIRSEFVALGNKITSLESAIEKLTNAISGKEPSLTPDELNRKTKQFIALELKKAGKSPSAKKKPKKKS